MLNYNNRFHFACPPGTGASWFVKACQLAGLGPGFTHRAYTRFPEGSSNVLKVSLVRHPCDWLAHRYEVLLSGRHNNHIGPFGGLCLDTFDKFVLGYLKLPTGAVGCLFDAYQADTCMKIEDMPWAFLELMGSLGIEQKLSTVVKGLRKPFSTDTMPTWNPALRNQVSATEREVMNRYDYW